MSSPNSTRLRTVVLDVMNTSKKHPWTVFKIWRLAPDYAGFAITEDEIEEAIAWLYGQAYVTRRVNPMNEQVIWQLTAAGINAWEQI